MKERGGDFNQIVVTKTKQELRWHWWCGIQHRKLICHIRKTMHDGTATQKWYGQPKCAIRLSRGPFGCNSFKQPPCHALVMADCVSWSLEKWNVKTPSISRGKEKETSVPAPNSACLQSRNCGMTLGPQWVFLEPPSTSLHLHNHEAHPLTTGLVQLSSPCLMALYPDGYSLLAILTTPLPPKSLSFTTRRKSAHWGSAV